ncbi:hypothetical protein [Pseudovibrio sp. JE062]|uniref:hypothetical protein n=1 Tax=Pseudovibrio sp. JE062 TaxID=439495 RepID=UPI000186C212|nr:hypothetical protein [Pseudovibrio sp. JE062]EEA93067.1 hypothetical protein PJE062_2216 [Pseudovibrio sp. JE062]
MVFVVLVVVFVVAVLSATEAMRAVIARFMVVFMLVIANIMLLNSAPKIGRAEIAYINLICQQAYSTLHAKVAIPQISPRKNS